MEIQWALQIRWTSTPFSRFLFHRCVFLCLCVCLSLLLSYLFFLKTFSFSLNAPFFLCCFFLLLKDLISSLSVFSSLSFFFNVYLFFLVCVVIFCLCVYFLSSMKVLANPLTCPSKGKHLSPCYIISFPQNRQIFNLIKLTKVCFSIFFALSYTIWTKMCWKWLNVLRMLLINNNSI